MTQPKKLYSIDPGLVRASTLDYENDLSRLFENVVYLDLRRPGCQVNYFKTTEGYGVDFLAVTARGEQKLFQVAWDMQSDGTGEREERALQAALKELRIKGELITPIFNLHMRLPPLKEGKECNWVENTGNGSPDDFYDPPKKIKADSVTI